MLLPLSLAVWAHTTFLLNLLLVLPTRIRSFNYVLWKSIAGKDLELDTLATEPYGFGQNTHYGCLDIKVVEVLW